LDKLVLGIDSANKEERIELPNITVRIIDSLKPRFVIGNNVLKYLAMQYKPSVEAAVYHLSLTEEGKKLLEQDRVKGIANSLTESFDFVKDYEAYKKALKR
jgi:hypothetical protein